MHLAEMKGGEKAYSRIDLESIFTAWGVADLIKCESRLCGFGRSTDLRGTTHVVPANAVSAM